METTKSATRLTRVEAAMEAMQHLLITPAVLATLRETARLYSTHCSTLFEPTRQRITEVDPQLQNVPAHPVKGQSETGLPSLVHPLTVPQTRSFGPEFGSWMRGETASWTDASHRVPCSCPAAIDGFPDCGGRNRPIAPRDLRGSAALARGLEGGGLALPRPGRMDDVARRPSATAAHLPDPGGERRHRHAPPDRTQSPTAGWV